MNQPKSLSETGVSVEGEIESNTPGEVGDMRDNYATLAGEIVHPAGENGEESMGEKEAVEKIFSRKIWSLLLTAAPSLVDSINKENRRFEHAEIEAALDAETLRKITALIREYDVWDEYTPTMSIPNEDGTRFIQIYDDTADIYPATDGLCLMVHKQSK